MTLHNHSNSFRKLFSVTQAGETIAIMKPSAQLRGWWILEGRGVCWINPLARDIEAVRRQAGRGEWPIDASWSAYNRTPRFMLIKGKRAAFAELSALNAQISAPL